MSIKNKKKYWKMLEQVLKLSWDSKTELYCEEDYEE